ncbi:MAG: oxidoreductase family protein [Actinomycetota bacterium]
MTGATIPAATTDITVDWLNERLADSDDVGTITGLEREPMGLGVGILGEIARLYLTYADGESGPATMIAKCQSAFEENIGLCQMMGFYVREVSFYQQLADSISIRVPRPFVADMEPGGAPFILVMEEVTGAEMIDQIDGANLDEAKRVLDAVAALHARFWDNDDLYALEWLPPMNNDMYKGAQVLGEANWPEFEANWGPKVPERTLRAVQAFTPIYPQALDFLYDFGTPTFAHTDCRAENYLFGGSAGADATTMLDFQLSTRHMGTFDLANFLGMSITIENRRAWQDELMEHYHGALMTGGVPASYTLDQCRTEYRYNLMQQAWAQLAIANVDPGNDRGRELLNAFVTRSFQAAEDNESYELLDQIG